jgi:hypothetical protein
MRRISIGRWLRASAFAGAVITATCLPAMAQPGVDAGGGARPRNQEQQRVRGSDLMTEQERSQYRERMRSAQTEQERERIRQEHHSQMTERARERGLQVPDRPGVGSGPRYGPGRGAGPGSGGGAGGRGGPRGQ